MLAFMEIAEAMMAALLAALSAGYAWLRKG